MTTQEVASRYQEMMNKRQFIQIQDIFYHENVICQEMDKATTMGMQVITRGLEAVKAKGVGRRATIEEIHSYECSAPLVAGEFFTVTLKQELTFKGKPRTRLEEIGVFHVQEGKIIKEQFFY